MISHIKLCVSSWIPFTLDLNPIYIEFFYHWHKTRKISSLFSSLIVTSSTADKKLEIKLEIYKNLEIKLEIYKNLENKLEIYSYFKLENKLEIFEFFVNGRWTHFKYSVYTFHLKPKCSTLCDP